MFKTILLWALTVTICLALGCVTNPITGEDVKKIAQGEEIEIYTKKDQQEIKNLIKAYNLLAGIEPTEKPFILTEELICELHKIITSDVPDEIALLFVAAPDLLQAAQAIVDDLARYAANHGDAVRRRLGELRAAIDKATPCPTS